MHSPEGPDILELLLTKVVLFRPEGVDKHRLLLADLPVQYKSLP